MQVKLLSHSVVQLIDEKSSVVICFSGGEYTPENNEIVLGNKSAEGVVSGPGEYEYAGVSVVGLETIEEKNGIADVFQVHIEGINVMAVLATPSEISNDQWELMGEIDVMLMDQNVPIEEADKFINKVNPYVLIMLNSTSAEAEKLTELSVEASEKKFKFSAKDFTAEDPVTRLLLLA